MRANSKAMKQQWKGGQEVFENGRHQGAMVR